MISNHLFVEAAAGNEAPAPVHQATRGAMVAHLASGLGPNAANVLARLPEQHLAEMYQAERSREHKHTTPCAR